MRVTSPRLGIGNPVHLRHRPIGDGAAVTTIPLAYIFLFLKVFLKRKKKERKKFKNLKDKITHDS